MPENPKLVEAKITLYTELLKADPEEATDQEIAIMFALSKDIDIQYVLAAAHSQKKG